MTVLKGKCVRIGDIRPSDTDRGVIPAQPHVALGTIIIGHLVANNRVRLERAETMRKARRYPKLLAIVRTERLTDPLPECARTMADIHRNIEQRAGGAADKLALRMRLALKMESPNCPRLRAQGLIILNKAILAAMHSEEIGTERLGKISSLIANLAGRQQFDAGNVKGSDFHDLPFRGQPQSYPKQVTTIIGRMRWGSSTMGNANQPILREHRASNWVAAALIPWQRDNRVDGRPTFGASMANFVELVMRQKHLGAAEGRSYVSGDVEMVLLGAEDVIAWSRLQFVPVQGVSMGASTAAFYVSLMQQR